MTALVLYVVVCGAGPAPHVGRLVDQAHERGWDVHLVATPAAVDFIDVDGLEAQTGQPIRSDYRQSDAGRARSLPHADAIIVAPATYNTLNKWAQGISDNYALGLLAEAIGLRIPVVALPFVNAALAAHPAFGRSIAELREAGVRIIHGDGGLDPHPPGTGGERIDSFPWHLALEAAARLARSPKPLRSS